MTDFMMNAHSGWRYVVLVYTAGLALFFLYALLTDKTKAKTETTLLKVWAGVVDFQLLLGILLIISKYILDGVEYYDALTGHWITGVVVAALGHMPTIYSRLNGQPNTQTRRVLGLALPVAALVLSALTILAIRDSLFSMS